MKKERTEVVIVAIDSLKRRFMDKNEREKESERLKLDLSLMCLNSEQLNRRIQGIKELSSITKVIKFQMN